MTEPLRVQRRRTRGFRLPPNTVCVTRPGKFGNPFNWRDGLDVGSEAWAKGASVELYREWLRTGRGPSAPTDEEIAALRGKNLACFCRLCPKHKDGKPFAEWCPECDPCHADHLGLLANAPVGDQPFEDFP